MIFFLWIISEIQIGSVPQGGHRKLSVKPAPLCETAKSGFDFRVQECHTSVGGPEYGLSGVTGSER